MQIVKQSVARSIPCILIKSSDGQTPETGALAASVTISYRKEGGTTWSSKTATGNWTEVTAGKGVYLISWSTTDLNTIGRFDLVVEHASCINYYGSLVVSANLLDDIDTTLDALNDPTVAAIADGVWDELKAGHTTADSFGDYLDDEITSRSSHTAAAVVALMNDLDATEILAALTTDSTKWAGADIAAIVSAIAALNDVAVTDILSDSTAFAGADIAALVTAVAALPTAAGNADAVWDELYAPHVTVGSFAELVKANLDAAISSRSSHAAADVVALMNDLNAAEILAAITTDSVKFSGTLIANLDAAITTRSSHAAADVVALMNDPTVAAIWGEVQSGYTTPGTFGYFLDLQVSAAGGGAAPTVAQIAEAVHDVKVSFNKTTGALVITMADDTPLTSVTITDTAGEVTRA